MKKLLLLIDGNALVHRAYHALAALVTEGTIEVERLEESGK